MNVERILVGVPLFAGLDQAELARVAALAQVKGYLAGMPLFSAGDPSDSFYVVARGSVRIRLPASTAGVERAFTLEAGKFFGEMGVLGGQPRTGDAVVAEDSVLVRISREDFDRLMAVDQAIAEKVMESYMGRVAELEESRRSAKEMKKDPGCLLFFSSGGGAGASFLCANLALKIRDLCRKQVLVLDLDVQAPCQHLYLGSSQPGALPSLIGAGELSPAAIRERAHKLHHGVDLLGGPGVPPVGRPTPAEARELVRAARKAYGYVLIDTTSAFSPLNEALFDAAGFTHLVLGPDIVSVSRSVGLVRQLEEQGLKDRLRLLLNKFQPGEGISPELLEKKFGREVMGRVEYQHELAVGAVNEGVPVVKRNPKAPLTVDLTRLARQLVSQLSSPPGADQGFSLWSLFG